MKEKVKNEIIFDIVEELMENMYESQQDIKSLLVEALVTKSIKELKEINA